MKKLHITALLLGAGLFMTMGATSLSASGMKCGPGKCGSAMSQPASKCGGEKATKSTTKAAAKCGASKTDSKCGAEKKVAKKTMKCGEGKCGQQ